MFYKQINYNYKASRGYVMVRIIWKGLGFLLIICTVRGMIAISYNIKPS
ncbi:putative membrane protein [Propionispora sp. 2/2-37]|nr:putative membrane protein [Propionispora sp. 2/2-37]